jgi:trans-aconitate methyltransferase
MGRRSSNVARNRWAVQLLDVQPTDRVIEVGCGPGVAIAALATRATRGVVVGVDHSQVMIGQAAYAQPRPDGQPWTARTLAEVAGCGRSSAASFLQRQRPPASERTQ